MPLLTTASAISRMSLSLTLQPNLFQLFQPIGGVGARDADVCADVAGARRAAKAPTTRQARRARIKENHRKFIFPRNIGYVTAYAESSTQRQKVRCYSTRQKNSPALAYAAHKISTAFDQDKCATGVRTLPAHTESNRTTMTFLPSKFLPALLLMPVLFALCGAAQEPEDGKPQKPESMGVATGNPHAPVKDALSRPITAGGFVDGARSEEHTSELQSRLHLVCRLLLEKKKIRPQTCSLSLPVFRRSCLCQEIHTTYRQDWLISLVQRRPNSAELIV